MHSHVIFVQYTRRSQKVSCNHFFQKNVMRNSGYPNFCYKVHTFTYFPSNCQICFPRPSFKNVRPTTDNHVRTPFWSSSSGAGQGPFSWDQTHERHEVQGLAHTLCLILHEFLWGYTCPLGLPSKLNILKSMQ